MKKLSHNSRLPYRDLIARSPSIKRKVAEHWTLHRLSISQLNENTLTHSRRHSDYIPRSRPAYIFQTFCPVSDEIRKYRLYISASVGNLLVTW
jgi:hypothetical protein